MRRKFPHHKPDFHFFLKVPNRLRANPRANDRRKGPTKIALTTGRPAKRRSRRGLNAITWKPGDEILTSQSGNSPLQLQPSWKPMEETEGISRKKSFRRRAGNFLTQPMI